MTDTIVKSSSTENQLLRVLPAAEKESLRARLERVELSFRQVLGKPGETTESVYFPIDSIVSVVASNGGKRAIELAMIGSEGVTGIASIFGADPKLYETTVQVAGAAWRISLDALREQLAASNQLFALLARYQTAFYVQTAQSGVCPRFHNIEKRLQTWLLMMFDRLKSDELRLTQDDIANALGYRRPSLAEASAALQEANVIKYSRGRIRLLDRQRLRANVCECYDIMETQHDKVFLPALNNSAVLTNQRFDSATVAPRSQTLAPKADNGLNDHFKATNATIERIQRSCERTAEVCRRQIEMLNRQRADFKLVG